MAIVKANQIVSCEVPDNLNDSLVVRITDVEFGESKSSGNPMITVKPEIVGIRNKQNGVDDHMIVDGKKYVIAGLPCRPSYFSLSSKALARLQDFWSKVTGRPKEEFEIDTENPDLTPYKGAVMSAVVKAELTKRTKQLTPEQKEELKAAGKPLVGEPVVDDEGKELPPFKSATVDTWNRRFNGELPQF